MRPLMKRRGWRSLVPLRCWKQRAVSLRSERRKHGLCRKTSYRCSFNKCTKSDKKKGTSNEKVTVVSIWCYGRERGDGRKQADTAQPYSGYRPLRPERDDRRIDPQHMGREPADGAGTGVCQRIHGAERWPELGLYPQLRRQLQGNTVGADQLHEERLPRMAIRPCELHRRLYEGSADRRGELRGQTDRIAARIDQLRGDGKNRSANRVGESYSSERMVHRVARRAGARHGSHQLAFLRPIATIQFACQGWIHRCVVG